MVAGALLGVATLVEGLLAASVAEAADAGSRAGIEGAVGCERC
jgi:hypothetical protein